MSVCVCVCVCVVCREDSHASVSLSTLGARKSWAEGLSPFFSPLFLKWLSWEVLQIGEPGLGLQVTKKAWREDVVPRVGFQKADNSVGQDLKITMEIAAELLPSISKTSKR